ncbi:MAG: MerR family transcriptional regulator [Proteobacteria bacterium]|jgi:DNA-binding transcriptional MerR regulator|nr:MerR family transcriptional regulator [Pseudomonadota bacterium]
MKEEEELAAVEVPDKLFFRIGEAAELVGVEPHVLRYWESEFKMRPQRSSTGQRMFRRKDIARFLRIRRLLHEEGFTIAGARKALSASPGDSPIIDEGRLHEVANRIEGLRSHIARVRERIARVLIVEPKQS